MGNSKLYIYTEQGGGLFYRLKSLTKKLLKKDSRGPEAVKNSLTSGLTELGVEFLINKKIENICEVACVLSGRKTLLWALEQKKIGKIKKLVAGPNIVISPNDFGGLIKNPLIDVIVVPSQWVKDYFVKLAPGITNRLVVWPAGVTVPILEASNKTIDFLIYNKIVGNNLVSKIVETLQQKNYSFQIINYGAFHQEAYFTLLNKSKYEIYLSESESQGLAMFEAWARGVPTLVWDKGLFEYQGVSVMGLVSSPYLKDQTGMRFSDLEDFKLKLPIFVGHDFAPRQITESFFSNIHAAQAYLKLAAY